MKLFGLFLSAILLLIVFVVPSYAIPAFTRANNVECSTCHTIFPELNEYGEAFLKNGYVYFGKGKKKGAEKAVPAPVAAKPKAAPVAAKPAASAGEVKGDGNADLLNKLKAGMMVSTGAPAPDAPADDLAAENGNAPAHAAPVGSGEPKAEGILLSGIPEQLPISFSANMHGTYNPDAINEFDFSTRSLKINTGGHFREKAGFFGTYLLYTEGVVPSNANTSTVPANLLGKSDIGELFLIWRHLFDTPINIRVGRFQPKLGLWKSNNKLSTTNSYATYSYTVGDSLFKAEQPQDAIETNMIIADRLFLAGGVVNRKNQNTKEYFGHLSVKLGGADYLANEPEIDLNKEESILDFLTLTVGGYGYVGTNGEPNTTPGYTPLQNEYYRAGVDVDLLYKLARLKLSGVLGKDDRPVITSSYAPEKSYVGAIEGDYSILQNLILALRFEFQNDGTNIVRRYIPTIAYAPIENLKIAAEYKYEYGRTSSKTDIENQIGTLGVTLSF